MSKPKQRLEIRFIQEEGIITLSTRIPEEQAKTWAKVLWGILGGGVVWLASHLPATNQPPVRSPEALPPTPAQVKNS
ncbi:MAG: hypothetical protein VKJ24_19250 [Synechococcales bacterium]|nr:hypothetical protein [Synechococcales bacterium]